MRNKAKQNSSLFFRFFHFFSLNFRFASIFSLNFRLFYLRFRFRFLVFRIEVNHVKSGFFFASKRNKIFASVSNFASEAKVRAHPSFKYILAYLFLEPRTAYKYKHFLNYFSIDSDPPKINLEWLSFDILMKADDDEIKTTHFKVVSVICMSSSPIQLQRLVCPWAQANHFEGDVV